MLYTLAKLTPSSGLKKLHDYVSLYLPISHSNSPEPEQPQTT